MKPIGTKTISVLALFGLCLSYIAYRQSMDLHHFEYLSPAAAFCIGLFTCVVGVGAFRFWHLNRPSESYFRLGRRAKNLMEANEEPVLEVAGFGLYLGHNPSRTLEFPFILMGFFTLSVYFLIAVICFDARTVATMLDAPRKLTKVDNQYCPNPNENKKPVASDGTAIKTGCELVYRAYEMGLVKELGSCGDSGKEQKLELCTLRQFDEPYLHYMNRKVSGFIQKSTAQWSSQAVRQHLRMAFQTQLDHFHALLAHLQNVVHSSPKASHHIFTNLAAPADKKRTNRECLAKYQKQATTLGQQGGTENSLFDKVFGQMLFNPKFDDPVGLCQEYEIHWNAPVDACEQLSRNPETFLKSMGIATEVQSVLKRVNDERDLLQLHFQLPYIKEGMPLPLPPTAAALTLPNIKPHAFAQADTVVSFQCFMQVPKASDAQTRTVPLTVFGQTFLAKEVKFAVSTASQGQIELYKNFAQVMIPEEFKATGYSSHNALGTTQWNVTPNTFMNPEYRLTELEYLKGADIFFGNNWLQNQEDLLEVYPYYHHLYHFVELFRSQYRMQRTRL